jgi:hypothetical protein
MSLLRRNLFSAVTLRYQAGEFRQERIGSDQQNLSRGVSGMRYRSRSRRIRGALASSGGREAANRSSSFRR